MDLQGIDRIRLDAASDALEAKLGSARDAAAAGRAGEAARAFEKLFATLLVREMSATLKDGFFGDGPGAETFQGWMEEHLGDALTAGRGLGLAETVRASLLREAPAEEAP